MIVDVSKIKDSVKEYLNIKVNINTLKLETIQMFDDWLQKAQYGHRQNSQDIINNIIYISALSYGDLYSGSEWVDLPILDTMSLDGMEIIIDYIKETAGYAKEQGDYAKESGDTALEAAEIANNTKGWTPVHLFIKVSEEIIVKRLTDYIGGTRTKPTDNIGQYVSENGYTSDINEALNFKGLSADLQLTKEAIENTLTGTITSHNHGDMYSTPEDLEDHINDTNNPHNVTKNQIGLSNVNNTSDLDKPISNLTKQYIDDAINDIEQNETDPTVPQYVKEISEQDIENWDNKSDFSGSYDDLSDIPDIPTKTSDLTNDSGFINQSDIPAETDPTVPSWAKQTSKPTYNYTEITGIKPPSDAQKNSDITKAEIEDKLTGDITSHNHDTQINAALANKVDKEAGKVLSDNNYTDEDKNKLTNLESSKFLGAFSSQSELLINYPADGVGGLWSIFVGDKIGCTADVSVSNIIHQFSYNGIDTWTDMGQTGSDSAEMIKQKYESNLNTNAFTDLEKSKLTDIQANAQVNVKSDWNASSGDAEILNKPSIPSKVSDLTNDSGFLSTETDPMVPSWAKQANKPTYTKSEVGLGNVDNTSDLNKPVSTAQASAIDAKYTKPTLGIPKTDLVIDVQTSLGKADTALQSYTETDPTVPSWAKQTNKPTYTAAEVGAIPLTTPLFSGDYEDLNNKPTLGDLSSKNKVNISDINAVGVPSENTSLHGDGTWKSIGAGSANWGSIGGNISSQTDLMSELDNKVDSSRVLTNVPENAKFTDTTYTTGTLAQLNAESDTTGRLQTAKILNDWLTGKGYITSYTDTKYTAGNGLTLTNTEFSLPVTVTGTGTYVQSVEQNANGITVTLGTPPNTNTTYEEISEAEIDTGTASTLRTITARRVTFILSKVSTLISNAISALTKNDVGLGNLDNIQQATKEEFNTHDADGTRHITAGERSAWGAKWDYNESTIKGVKVNNAANADTVNGKTVAENVPAGAKFTDTVYTHPAGTNPHGTTKADVGLGNVDNTSDVNKPVSTAQQTAINSGVAEAKTYADEKSALAIPLTQKGTASGVAELDSSGKVLSSQLPSYVDDVLNYTTQSNFPVTGESGKIYITEDTNKTYRWTGSAYVEISPSIALGETSATAYRGDRGKIAYDHSQDAHAPANAQKNSDITKAEIEAKLTGNITSHTHSAYVPTSRTIAGKALTANITLAKGDVGLGNVDNTSDANKPVSTAQQTALNAKMDSNKFQVVESLPTSPVSGTFYFVKE